MQLCKFTQQIHTNDTFECKENDQVSAFFNVSHGVAMVWSNWMEKPWVTGRVHALHIEAPVLSSQQLLLKDLKSVGKDLEQSLLVRTDCCEMGGLIPFMAASQAPICVKLLRQQHLSWICLIPFISCNMDHYRAS